MRPHRGRVGQWCAELAGTRLSCKYSLLLLSTYSHKEFMLMAKAMDDADVRWADGSGVDVVTTCCRVMDVVQGDGGGAG